MAIRNKILMSHILIAFTATALKFVQVSWMLVLFLCWCGLPSWVSRWSLQSKKEQLQHENTREEKHYKKTDYICI